MRNKCCLEVIGVTLPNFFVPGAGKSGTTTFCLMLGKHPQIFMSDPVEPMFFSHEQPNVDWMLGYDQGIGEYEKLFDGAIDCRAIGEGSTSYMFFPNVIERIKKHIDNPKFIFIFRNPIDRAFSHYCFNMSYGTEDRSFEDAFRESINLVVDPWSNRFYWGGYPYYYQNALSGKWVQRYIQEFGKNNVLVIFFEDLKNDTIGILNKCASFLDVSPFKKVELLHSNKTKVYKYRKIYLAAREHWRSRRYSWIGRVISRTGFQKIVHRIWPEERIPTLTNQQRDWVRQYLTEDVSKLKELIGSDIPCWEDFR